MPLISSFLIISLDETRICKGGKSSGSPSFRPHCNPSNLHHINGCPATGPYTYEQESLIDRLSKHDNSKATRLSVSCRGDLLKTTAYDKLLLPVKSTYLALNSPIKINPSES